MKFEFKSIGVLSIGSATDGRFTMEYKRYHDQKVFRFQGKAPSRRLLREMIKQCEKLSNIDN